MEDWMKKIEVEEMKYSTWCVLRRNGRKRIETIETTKEPMTHKEAMKYFSDAYSVGGMIG